MLKRSSWFLPALVIVFGLHVLIAFFDNPPPWPDEALYTDIAKNILETGRASTTLWQGLVPGVEEQALWYPQLFFYILAFWYKLAGISLMSMRLLSFVFGTAVLILVLTLSRRLLTTASTKLLLLPALLLTLDYQFIRAVRLLRPEMVILLLVLAAYFISINRLKKPSGLNRHKNLITGILLGLAVLIHPLALVFLPPFIIDRFIHKSASLKKDVLILILGFSIPLIIWLFTVFPHRQLLLTQMSLMTQRKSLEPPWLFIIFDLDNHLLKLATIGQVIASLIFIVITFIKKPKSWLLPALILIAAWTIALGGKMLWYIVYPLPFIYLGIALVLDKKPVPKLHRHFRRLTIILGLTLTLLSLNTLLETKRGQYSVDRFYQTILEEIPDGASVFLSAIPDPYFILDNPNRTHQLTEFPSLPVSQRDYAAVLAKVDYVIYTQSYDTDIAGNFLAAYLNLNSESAIPVTDAGYQARIFKLIDPDQRTIPEK